MRKIKAIPYEQGLIERLRDPEAAAAYLNAALAEEDQATLMIALRDVAKARSGGVERLAKDIGMHRVSLTRALSAKGNPVYSSLNGVLRAAGLRLRVDVNKQRQRKRAA